MWEIANLKGFRASFAEFWKGQKIFFKRFAVKTMAFLEQLANMQNHHFVAMHFFDRHSPAISLLCYTETKLYLEGIA